MFEVYCRKPIDAVREQAIAELIAEFGGEVTCREVTATGICLTVEFASRDAADAASKRLWDAGEHVEGGGDYGED